jgi:hypothetical protein
MKIYFTSTPFIILLYCIFINNNVQAQIKKPISPPIVLLSSGVLRQIDTCLKPISAITEIYQKDIQRLLARLDYLDGEEDDQIKNYSTAENDLFITNNIYKAAKHAAVYIENETFDKNVTNNFNQKKRFLVQIKENINQFLVNNKTQKFELDSFAKMMVRTEDLAQATREGTFLEFIKNNPDLATYFNKGLFNKNDDALNGLLNNLCKTNPQMMGSDIKTLQKYSNMCDVINYLATNKSNEILNYITSTSNDKNTILRCTNPIIVSIQQLAEQSKKPLRSIAMLGEFQRGGLTINQCDSIATNDDTYFRKLIALHQAQETISKNVIERDLKLIALDYIRQMNELHNSNDVVRFKCIENLGPEEIYYICVLGNTEIYTSSYLGCYKRMMTKLKTKNGFDLIELVNQDKFRTFIRMCANYNTLNEFLATMTTSQKTDLMKAFVSGLGSKKTVDLEGAVDVADSFGSITDKELLKYLQQIVNESFEKYAAEQNPKVSNVYKILNSLFSADAVTNANLKNQLQLPSLSVIENKNLHFDSVATVYEQMFFYGDDDGKIGYKNFLGTFGGRWKIDNSNPEWVVIKSVQTKTPFVIYANKPLDEPHDEYAQKHLIDFLIEKDIHPTIMVHRGHSYHLKSTIEALNYENKIVILGSCGGYQNLSEILRRCPDAHIVSTKQVGVFKVNTPIINEVNNSICDSKDVDWVSIWAKLAKQFKGTADESFFNDYVPPHKNLGSLFLKSYAKMNTTND